MRVKIISRELLRRRGGIRVVRLGDLRGSRLVWEVGLGPLGGCLRVLHSRLDVTEGSGYKSGITGNFGGNIGQFFCRDAKVVGNQAA